ncbi:MAG TPA: squalene synthase HpnC [Pseudonocardiaceae bacterium]
MASAPLHACLEWSTALFRRYAPASPAHETNLSHSTTTSSPLDKASSENFSVAARVLPTSIRRHLQAIYVFARLVDDIGDEAIGDRITLLDKVSRDLDHIYAGRQPSHGMLADLAKTIHDRAIPREPFDRLIAANKQDQFVHRYATYADLLGYCELSANPVGHLVLYVFQRATPDRMALSDKVCSALQILEHCQDVAEDLAVGRIYLPQQDMERFGVDEPALKAAPASFPVRGLVAFEVQRAVRLLDEGRPLVDRLRGTARLAISGYLAGGIATAAALGDAGYDVLTATPRPSKTVALRHWADLFLIGGGGR